jgi:hypothetical protein
LFQCVGTLVVYFLEVWCESALSEVGVHFFGMLELIRIGGGI